MVVGIGLLVIAGASYATRGQQTTSPIDTSPIKGLPQTTSGTGPHSILNDEAAPGDAATARMQEQRAHLAQDERHKRMAQDADKLLALATELKADVDKATKNETSVTAFQKANEIEKLAHDVKERLRN
jgi:hypothetical protein